MKKNKASYLLALLGLLLLGAGLFLIKAIAEPEGVLQVLPSIFIGLGCGIFGHGMGDIISQKAIKKNPELEKQMEIEKNDERNLAIGNRAKAKAYDCMIFVFGALMLAFALMRVDMTAVLLLVFAYLFVVGTGVYYRCKYDKEM